MLGELNTDGLKDIGQVSPEMIKDLAGDKFLDQYDLQTVTGNVNKRIMNDIKYCYNIQKDIMDNMATDTRAQTDAKRNDLLTHGFNTDGLDNWLNSTRQQYAAARAERQQQNGSYDVYENENYKDQYGLNSYLACSDYEVTEAPGKNWISSRTNNSYETPSALASYRNGVYTQAEYDPVLECRTSAQKDKKWDVILNGNRKMNDEEINIVKYYLGDNLKGKAFNFNVRVNDIFNNAFKYANGDKFNTFGFFGDIRPYSFYRGENDGVMMFEVTEDYDKDLVKSNVVHEYMHNIQYQQDGIFAAGGLALEFRDNTIPPTEDVYDYKDKEFLLGTITYNTLDDLPTRESQAQFAEDWVDNIEQMDESAIAINKWTHYQAAKKRTNVMYNTGYRSAAIDRIRNYESSDDYSHMMRNYYSNRQMYDYTKKYKKKNTNHYGN